jgi:hypothetical protein
MAMQIPKPKQLQALGLIAFKASQKLVKAPTLSSSRTTKAKGRRRGRKPAASATP